MKLQVFAKSWQAQQRALIGTVILSGMLGLGMAVQAYSLSTQERVVVLVPPTLTVETEVSPSGAGADYKRAWAVFVATQLGSITPGTAQFLRPTLEPLLAPAIYRDVITRMEGELDKIRRDKLSIQFEPREVVLEAERDRVFVHGTQLTHTMVGAETRVAVTYEMTISVADYRPQITWLNTYEGAPRTAQWIERNGAALEQRRAEAEAVR